LPSVTRSASKPEGRLERCLRVSAGPSPYARRTHVARQLTVAAAAAPLAGRLFPRAHGLTGDTSTEDARIRLTGRTGRRKGDRLPVTGQSAIGRPPPSGASAERVRPKLTVDVPTKRGRKLRGRRACASRYFVAQANAVPTSFVGAALGGDATTRPRGRGSASPEQPSTAQTANVRPAHAGRTSERPDRFVSRGSQRHRCRSTNRAARGTSHPASASRRTRERS
jgi:hypothetical protein